MTKTDSPLNTALGNMLTAICREQATPVHYARTLKTIDIILLNQGGIRASLAQGEVTMRNAYEIMPFENELVVAELTGLKIIELVDYLVEHHRAHPIDGLEIILHPDRSLKQATVLGEPIDLNKRYRVVTTDYLQNGGDNMTFLLEPENLTKLNYKLRNAMIDYFTKVDTLDFKHDSRFIID